MTTLFLIIGTLWAIYVFIKNSQQPKSTREHWFPAILFSFFLWWLMIPLSWSKGIIQQDFEPLVTGIRVTIDRIFGK